MELTYRLLEVSEIPSLEPLMNALAEHHARVAESFNDRYPIRPIADQLGELGEMIAAGKGRAEAAFDDGRMIGFGAATWEKRYGDIDFLFVIEAYRGRGVGSRLLDGALARLRQAGVSLVDVGVALGNRADGLYKRHGFRLRSRVFSLEM